MVLAPVARLLSLCQNCVRTPSVRTAGVAVRGFMAGAMKKAGYQVESFKPDGGGRTYRIDQ
jgi:hypothetical protein